MEMVKRSVVTRGWWEDRGGMNSWGTEDFQGSETILYDMVMMDA